MRLSKKLELGTSLLYSKLFNKRSPIFTCFYLTHRCNLKCRYCDIPSIKRKELNTNQILKIINKLSQSGCKCINFSGGEPLLREDIGKIISYAKSKGIYVGINSNGLLVKSKIEEIKNADLLQLSFDGPKEIHDMQRGKGSYDKVIEAIRIAKKNGIKTAISTTLTKHNVSFIKDIINFIQKERILAHFQPVAPILGPSSFKKLEIPKEEYLAAINLLIDSKKKCRFIVNTTTGLKYLKEENKRFIKCGAFKINCVIAPNGDLYPCNGLYNRIKPYNCVELGFKEAFMKSKPINCNSCLCSSTLDVALFHEKMFSLDPIAVADIINSGLK